MTTDGCQLTLVRHRLLHKNTEIIKFSKDMLKTNTGIYMQPYAQYVHHATIHANATGQKQDITCSALDQLYYQTDF